MIYRYILRIAERFGPEDGKKIPENPKRPRKDGKDLSAPEKIRRKIFIRGLFGVFSAHEKIFGNTFIVFWAIVLQSAVHAI